MSIKILITDDHDEFRTTLHRYLEESSPDFKIFEASSGELSILKALREKPDIVLMDIRLPEMNGIEAARRIKQNLPESKIIILTMFETEAFREIFKSDDIEAYIGKSELYEELLPMISSLAENKV